MSNTDEEDFTFYRVSWHRAQIDHTCCECGLPIDAEEYYELLVGKCGGIWYKYRTCMYCASVRQTFCTQGFVVTHLHEDLLRLRGSLSYDDVRQWALLTNAIAGYRARHKAANTYLGTPPLTPLPASRGRYAL